MTMCIDGHQMLVDEAFCGTCGKAKNLDEHPVAQLGRQSTPRRLNNKSHKLLPIVVASTALLAVGGFFGLRAMSNKQAPLNDTGAVSVAETPTQSQASPSDSLLELDQNESTADQREVRALAETLEAALLSGDLTTLRKIADPEFVNVIDSSGTASAWRGVGGVTVVPPVVERGDANTVVHATYRIDGGADQELRFVKNADGWRVSDAGLLFVPETAMGSGSELITIGDRRLDALAESRTQMLIGNYELSLPSNFSTDFVIIDGDDGNFNLGTIDTVNIPQLVATERTLMAALSRAQEWIDITTSMRRGDSRSQQYSLSGLGCNYGWGMGDIEIDGVIEPAAWGCDTWWDQSKTTLEEWSPTESYDNVYYDHGLGQVDVVIVGDSSVVLAVKGWSDLDNSWEIKEFGGVSVSFDLDSEGHITPQEYSVQLQDRREIDGHQQILGHLLEVASPTNLTTDNNRYRVRRRYCLE